VRSAANRSRRTGRIAVLTVVLTVVGLAGCASDSAPEVPAGPNGSPDPVLVAGRNVFARRCATCHGLGGGGGRGPKLSDGRVVQRYPDVADQVAVVTNGRGGMPKFGDVLDPDEIEAVVRYTREVLSAS
jgi:mono/diheme cytochrome c family protein